MTIKLGDRIRQTTETEGVGAIALIDPEPGYFSFVDVLGNGAQTFYAIDNGLGQFEGGLGTITAGATDTISRDTIFFSSNSGAAVDFDAGVKTIVCALSSAMVLWSADTFGANNVPMSDGAYMRAKTRAQIAKRVTVDIVATTNINLASGLVAGVTIDGVTLSLTGADDGTPHRVLLTAQSTAKNNGVYKVVASGTASRDSDFDTAAELPPMLKFAVRQGTAGAGTEYLFTTAPGFTLGTTSLTFAKSNSAHAREIAAWAGADDDFAQQKAGAITNRTPDQALVDLLAAFAASTRGQLAFPATQNPSSNANTLDDYEEGTFTPVVTFGGASVGVTYTTQTGFYVKVGRIVHFVITIVLSSKGSSTGSAMASLPFTSDSTSGNTPPCTLRVSGLTATNVNAAQAFVNSNATTASLRKFVTSTGNDGALSDADCTNTSVLQLEGSYLAAA